MAKKTTETTSSEMIAKDTDQETALANNALYEQFAGEGFENQTNDDVSIPFLTVLQGQSAALNNRTELRGGMILNTVTGEYVEGKNGVLFVPVTTKHCFVEWKPRTAGGGFVALHETDSPVVSAAKSASKTFGKYSTPAGNDLIETFYVYGLAAMGEGQEYTQAVLSFCSTMIKKYKGWMTKARSIQLQLPGGRRMVAPLFSHQYRLTTVSEKNNKGSWFSWSINYDGPDAASSRLKPSDSLFQFANEFKKTIELGQTKIDHSSQVNEGSAGPEHPANGADEKPVF